MTSKDTNKNQAKVNIIQMFVSCHIIIDLKLYVTQTMVKYCEIFKNENILRLSVFT